MRFEKFEIFNFKGIDSSELPLSPRGTGIFTLIGLNESGKTTILEALNAWDFAEGKHAALYSEKEAKVERTSFIPKHKKSNFTGLITVLGHITMTETDRQALASLVENECNCSIDKNSIPLAFRINRSFEFKNSDYVNPKGGINVSLMVKRYKTRKFVQAKNEDAEWKAFARALLRKLPEIIYFPTFLFAQPERIYLFDKTARDQETDLNRLYRQIFESVATSLSTPVTLQEHVVARALSKDKKSDKKEQLDATLNDLSTALSDVVFEGWAKVFGRGVAGREVVIRSGIEDIGAKKVVYLEIYLREGGQTFKLSERSTGFRWFFSFIIFTIYRLSPDRHNTLFLLDEPASNLHAKAQGQLIESLRRLASNQTEIIYTTHSHYMICPEWLDQSFIISNSSVDYDENVNATILYRPQPTSVRIEKYRNFVGKNPDKMTYFQPILDRLNVVPSRIDILKKSVLTEGKSDYLLLQYGFFLNGHNDLDFNIVPTRGATGMDELVGLFKGWGVPFMILLDDDHEGRSAAKKYINEWHLPANQVITLADISAELKGKDVRGFLHSDDEKMISTHFSIEKKANKGQIQLFFSEMLAQKANVKMSTLYNELISKTVEDIKKFFLSYMT